MGRLRSGDIIILAIFIILIALSIPSKGDSAFVRISSSGGKEEVYELSEDRIVTVEGPLGTTTIEIKDGDVRIIDSPCEQKTCMNTRIGDTICCLPNKVLVTISADGEYGGIDVVAY